MCENHICSEPWKNIILEEIKGVIWASKIPLSKDRVDNVSFVGEEMDFKYPNNIDEFDDLLDYFQRQRVPCNNNYLGENIKLDNLLLWTMYLALLINQKHLLIF